MAVACWAAVISASSFLMPGNDYVRATEIGQRVQDGFAVTGSLARVPV